VCVCVWGGCPKWESRNHGVHSATLLELNPCLGAHGQDRHWYEVAIMIQCLCNKVGIKVGIGSR